MAFPEQNTWILRSFDLNSVLTRQTAEKVAFKSGFDNLTGCFLPSTFARISSIKAACCPKNFENFCNWAGGGGGGGGALVRLCY